MVSFEFYQPDAAFAPKLLVLAWRNGTRRYPT